MGGKENMKDVSINLNTGWFCQSLRERNSYT